MSPEKHDRDGLVFHLKMRIVRVPELQTRLSVTQERH